MAGFCWQCFSLRQPVRAIERTTSRRKERRGELKPKLEAKTKINDESSGGAGGECKAMGCTITVAPG
jgi:hypothetical protein